MSFPVLTSLVFLPLIGAVAVLCVPKREAQAIRATATVFSGISLLLSVWMLVKFRPGAGFQFVEKFWWVKPIGMKYYMAADGLSVPLLFLTALLTFLCVIWSWHIREHVKAYFFLILLLEVGMLGVFVALDFVLFFVFWELVLLPMYFLIGIWGGERRRYASIKFFLYTLVGSVVMLLGILALYFYGPLTFDMLEIAKYKYPPAIQSWVFWAFFLGFAIKVPIFPFHTWLPDAHVEAPTAGSVLLAGVLLKMGTYGFLRVSLPMFPEASHQYAYILAILGVVSIIYGAAVAMAQKDMKKMIAYSSVSHMGYVILGTAAANQAGLDGAVLQMFNHGIITGALFFLVGMVYERAHTKEIAKLGGLALNVPLLGGVIAFASFASLGLPGLSGFVGEFTALLGGFQAYRTETALAVIGVVLTAAFFLRMLQQVVFGETSMNMSDFRDLDWREWAALAPLMAITVVLGLFPMIFLNVVNPFVNGLAKMMGS